MIAPTGKQPVCWSIMFHKIENYITFRVERFLLGGAVNQLLFIAFIMLLVSLFAGFTVYLLYPGSGNFFDSVWWAFLRLSDPGYLGDDQGVIRRLVSTFVTILGYVLFMGSLVAIMTQWLNGTIKKLEMGLTPISLKGHVVILGWTNRTSIIVKEFLLSEERMNRFLRTIKRSKLKIVIVADEVNSAVMQELKDEIGDLWEPGVVIFRSGSPLRIDHIKRADILNAGIVIIPGASFVHGGAENMDTRSIKAMMSIHQYARQKEESSPDIVTEILDSKKMPVIKSLYHGRVEVVASNIIISKIMTQNIRHHGLAVVYDELLSNAGNEIYIRDSGSFAGMTFKAAGSCFSRSVLIGIIPQGLRPAAVMNPEYNTVISETDRLVMISEEFKTTEPLQPGVDDGTEEKIEMIEAGAEKNKMSRVLIIGWSYKMPSLMKELGNRKSNITAIDNFSALDADERKSILEHQGTLPADVPVRFLTGNSTHEEDSRQLDIASYSEILMVANDWMDSGEEADARTIMGYVMMKKKIAHLPVQPAFVVELMDPDNRSLVSEEDDVIVSPLLISYSLAQISMNRELRFVYDELFTSGGTEIYIVPMGHYRFVPDEKISFNEIRDTVLGHGETAIGICQVSENGKRKIHLNPGHLGHWQLNVADQIIVLSSDS